MRTALRDGREAKYFCRKPRLRLRRISNSTVLHVIVIVRRMRLAWWLMPNFADALIQLLQELLWHRRAARKGER